MVRRLTRRLYPECIRAFRMKPVELSRFAVCIGLYGNSTRVRRRWEAWRPWWRGAAPGAGRSCRTEARRLAEEGKEAGAAHCWRRRHTSTREAQNGTNGKPGGASHGSAPVRALAYHWEQLVREGVVRDYADIARLAGLTRARVTQIVNLMLLDPALQEEVLLNGRPTERLSERRLRIAVSMPDWKAQDRSLRQNQREAADQ